METLLEQSPTDKNEYDLFKLDNGVTCLLVNDLNQAQNKTCMAYCAVVLNVGSFNDLPNRPGIAHFTEHMIFMGSGKYPNENAFSEHLSQNGGDSNAFTENELTNYHFSIKFEGLQKALDMQANLLADPLFKKDSMCREIQAVD